MIKKNVQHFQRTERSGRQRTCFVALAAGVSISLAGCIGAPEPTVMASPDIVWERNLAPSSALEDSPLVQAARQSDIGKAVAYNAGDFTIAQFNDTWDRRYVEYLAESYATQEDRPIVYPGPRPWQPVRIVEEDDDEAILEVCEIPPGRGWVAGRFLVGGQFDRSTAELRWYEFLKIDGLWKRTISGEHNGQTIGDCDGETIPVGYFDPQPELPDIPVNAPVRAPLPLGQDSEENERR